MQNNEIIEQARNFVVEQAPEVGRQIILWQHASTIISAGLTVILAGVLVYGFKRVKPVYEDLCDFNQALLSTGGIFVIVTTLVMLCCSMVEACHSLQAYLTPKAFLLEYMLRAIKP